MRLILLPLVALSNATPAWPADLPWQDPALVARGAPLFAEHCAPCHGDTAEGGNAPDIRGVILPDVILAAQGVEDMPEFDLPAPALAALAAYLSSLAPDQALQRHNARP